MEISIVQILKSEVAKMNDAKLTVDAIAELQAENERLKRLSKGWLEEKKMLNDKLEKIEQIVNTEIERGDCVLHCNLTRQIQEVLEHEGGVIND